MLWVLNGDSGVNEERQAGGGAGRRVEMDAEDAEESVQNGPATG